MSKILQPSRRGFLTGLLASALGAPSIVRASSLMALPRVARVSGLRQLTIEEITRESIRLWENSNFFIQNVEQQFDAAFAQGAVLIGTELRIRLPSDFTLR